jgi:hypothetical protein
MADLWEHRDKLFSEKEKEVIGLLDKLYRARKPSGLTQTQEITYKTSSKSEAGRKGYGRLYGYGGCSLEQLQADIRATLCASLYHDIDMVNAQPTLLRQLAERYGKSLPCLQAYVDRRDEFLEELRADLDCSRVEAKVRVLSVLYGGVSVHPILRALSTEIRTFASFLAVTDEWSELYSLTPADGKLASFLAYALQNEERHCLLAMHDYLQAHGWSVSVLAYDGCMAGRRADQSITPELLLAISDAIHAKTGYRVTLSEKPMTPLELPAPEAAAAEIAPGVTLTAYKAMKTRFEENHFWLAGSCKVCEYDLEANELRQFSKKDALDSAPHWFFPAAAGKSFTENTLFVPLWLKDPTRRTVKEIRMGPATDDPSVFTLPFRPA